MGKTNVKSYTQEQLLARVKSLPDFKSIPTGFWFIFVRSLEDEFDKFDDKVYLFENSILKFVTSCTTNKGANGTAVIKSDQWLYEGFIRGLHKEKMEAFRQNKPFWMYRDTNKDKKTDESGTLTKENVQTQFHGTTYIKEADVTRELIGPWSEGCIAANNNIDYQHILNVTRPQEIFSGCLIKEF